MPMEQRLEYLAVDELAEVTPGAIRVRKKFLNEEERGKRAGAA